MYWFLNKMCTGSCNDHQGVPKIKTYRNWTGLGQQPHRHVALSIPLLLLHQEAELLYNTYNYIINK